MRKYSDEAVENAHSIVYYDDPLRLAIPHEFLVKWLPEPPYGMLKTIFLIGPILFVYMYTITLGLIYLWMRLVTAYFIKVDKIIFFVWHICCHQKRVKVMPTLHIIFFTTKANHSDNNPFSWDTEGILFIVDN